METFLSGERIFIIRLDFEPPLVVWCRYFDLDGNLTIHSPNAVTALRNYIKSFQYSNPDRNINSWDAAVEEYCKGDTAMAVFMIPMRCGSMIIRNPKWQEILAVL